MKLVKAAADHFDLIYAEMEKNFIADERRDKKDAEKILGSEKFSIYLANNDDGVNVGFVTVWELTNFAFVEHFVIYERYRNKGYGGEALFELKKKYNALVLEAEPPLSGIQKRRIAFYERNGFLINPQKYIQPSYRIGGRGVELILMSFPSRLADFLATVCEVYENVYGAGESK